MSLAIHMVKDGFKRLCENLAGKDLPEVLFEGLADITKLPNNKPTKFIGITDSQNDHYCVISGRYRDRDGGEAVAIAIGLWDEERNCFSVLKKTKDGKSLPIPFRVKADKAVIEVRRIIRIFSGAQNLEEVLELYNKEARANQ